MLAPSATQKQPFFTKKFSRRTVDFILGGTGQCNVAGDRPDTAAAFVISGCGYGVHIFLDTAAAYFLNLLDYVELDAFRIMNIAIGIGQGHYLSPSSAAFSAA